jgi:uncharacterized membrane protein YhaH (DUF805 family)
MLSEPLGRLRFFVYGLLLSALKIGADYGVARAFGRAYSLLFYVSPMDAPLFHVTEDVRYWATLSATALPFIAVGVALTVRRLRDAGMSPYYSLLFFLPFANLLFFLVAALAPPREAQRVPAQPGAYRGGQARDLPAPQRSRGASTWMAGALGAAVALGALGVSVGLLRSYGAALMLGTPTISGFAAGAFYARLQPGGRFREAAVATLIATVGSFAVIVAFALEGVVCLAMALPLFMLPAFLGALIGFEACKRMPARTVDGTIGLSLLFFPALFAAERASPLPPLEPPPVETAIEINAPPERVWPYVVAVDEMPAPTDAPFTWGVTYPIRSTLDGEGIGFVRRCELSTGTALETVEVWRAARELVFRIDTQPDPMTEATLWRGPRQPHLDGYVRNLRGQFVLEPLAGGTRTRLVARSWYTVKMTPEAYWRLFSDRFIHAIHTRVMIMAKARAESNATPLASRQP